jgi:Flp pilus assembly protein TadG
MRLNASLTLDALDHLPMRTQNQESGASMNAWQKLWRDKRGNALVIAGASLPLIIGSAGLATDTIQWALLKRQLQRAADSAALAGVQGELSSQTVITGACSSSTPIARDLTIGDINNRIGATPTCAVQTPPSTGPWSSTTNSVRVTLSTSRTLAFSGLFMSAAPTITATATAAQVQSGRYCVVSLDNKTETGISFSGNASVNLGCGLKTNAKGLSAVNGGGSSAVTASPVAAVGQIANSGVFATGTTFQPFSAPQPDPYAAVNAPASNTFPSSNCPAFRVNANATQTGITANTDYKAMTGASSGYYCMASMTLNGNVTLPSGVYVIDGGDLSIGAQANVSCSGCTFVLTNRSTSSTPTIGSVNINGGATVTMSNMTSGTYTGLLFYQDRRATVANGNGQSNLINGNSSSSYAGSMYFPSTAMTFNGTSGMSTACVQLVAWQVAFTGNTNISNVCPGGPGGFDGSLVRLVE